MMKLHIPVAALATALIVGAGTCSEKATQDRQALAEAIRGKWVLEKLDHSAIDAPPPGREAPYLMVDSSGSRVSGFGGCNRLMGTLEVRGDSISFPGLVATRMYCEATQQLENSFLAALHAARTYALRNDRLVLSDGKELAVLRRSLP